jgi:hypothetical protein
LAAQAQGCRSTSCQLLGGHIVKHSTSIAASLIFFSLAVPHAATTAEIQSAEQDKFLYCRQDLLKDEHGIYWCNFGKTESIGCNSGMSSQLRREFIQKIDKDYKRCANGKILARIKLNSP